jgi:hypothetical protein
MTIHPIQADEERPIEIDVRRARGGRKGIHVLYVLVASCALILIAFSIIYFVFHHALPWR